MAAQPLTSLDRSTLRERALEALRTAISSGQYRPGDHLGEEELARRLGVSRGTVREALRHLQQDGLVTAGARGMLRVHSLSPVEIRDLFQVRGALEGLAVTLIIDSPKRNAAVAKLRKALSDLDDPDRDFTAHIDADLGFHLLLCQLSENSVLVDAWRHLRVRYASQSSMMATSTTRTSCRAATTPRLSTRSRLAMRPRRSKSYRTT